MPYDKETSYVPDSFVLFKSFVSSFLEVCAKSFGCGKQSTLVDLFHKLCFSFSRRKAPNDPFQRGGNGGFLHY